MTPDTPERLLPRACVTLSAIQKKPKDSQVVAQPIQTDGSTSAGGMLERVHGPPALRGQPGNSHCSPLLHYSFGHIMALHLNVIEDTMNMVQKAH